MFFLIKYLNGKANCAADTLSGYPTLSSNPKESDEADDELVWAAMVTAAARAADDKTEHVVNLSQDEEETVKDEESNCCTNVGSALAGLSTRTWNRLFSSHT